MNDQANKDLDSANPLSKEEYLAKIKELLDKNDAWLEQVKMTLLVVYNLEKSFQDMNLKYENAFAECDKIAKEIAEKKEQLHELLALKGEEFKNLQTEFLNIKAENLELLESASKQLEEITKIKDEIIKLSLEYDNKNEKALFVLEQIEYMKNELDSFDFEAITQRINKALLELKTKKDEALNELSLQSNLAQTSINNLSEIFRTEFEVKMTELDNKITLQAPNFELLNQKAEQLEDFINKKQEQFQQDFYNIDKLEEITFVQKDIPKQDEAKENDTWLDTNQGVINIYEKNPNVRFNQSDDPTNYASLYDTFHKNNKIADTEFNELHMFLQTENGKEWVKTNEVKFFANYQQSQQPALENSEPNQTWFEMDYLEVYYRENNAWVQISKKLEQARFIQDTEPSENQNVKLNDIWKKSDDEFFMFVAVNANGSVTNEWIALEKVYLFAKFMQEIEPVSVEGKVSVDMFDLWFKCDFSKFYVFAKKGENDTGSVFEWILVSEAKANARFKGEIAPNELMIGDFFFKHEANDQYQGELFEYKAKNHEYRFVTLKALEKYTRYKQEILPDEQDCENDDLCFKPYSKKYYILKDEINSRAWQELDINKEASFRGEVDLSTAKAGDIYQKDENSQKLFYMKLPKECFWQKQDEPKIKPYIWRNKNTDRLEIIENLMSPELSLEHTYKDILELNYPQQFVQKYHLDTQINALTQALNEAKTKLETNITNLDKKYSYDFVNVGGNPANIDFRAGNTFVINAKTSKSIGVANVTGCVGKSGIIIVYNCNLLQRFDARFKWRIAQSGFSGTEVFAFFIHDINWIRLVRS
ncbi:hypothetical protein DMB92_05215 [Campylobacter sp. MIT 99-7217]|uniref:hypothetical protein n=1 Tax=Campylobacter sp. MIT 99-7217 TaxID=535091 RepID=UPI00115741E9|nr:hypothetical protein [Campylobacter sp. MIT 99-7217]TQR31789.1 hypothetical protein DMB92_05215 [Campylobacter sp. MIT 99-7217]